MQNLDNLFSYTGVGEILQAVRKTILREHPSNHRKINTFKSTEVVMSKGR